MYLWKGVEEILESDAISNEKLIAVFNTSLEQIKVKKATVEELDVCKDL